MYLTFDNKFVDEILEGEKRTTWRLNKPKDLHPGAPINFLVNDGGIFTHGEVVWSKRVRIRDLSEEDMMYHESYDSDKMIVDELKEYYPRKEINPSTVVWVVRFKVFNDDYEDKDDAS